jgi:MFS family permease
LNTSKKFFYGYWVVLSGFLVTTLSAGILYYGYVVMNKIIADDLAWSRAEVTMAFFIFMWGMAVSSPLVGRLCDRIGPRKVILIGAIISVIALALVSQVQELWHYYVLHIFLGAGSIFAGPVPVSALIAQWFEKRRGSMQGLALGGIGFGGLAMGPLMGNFLSVAYGWRITYLIVAVIMLVIMVPLALFVIKDFPRQKGLLPYGQGELVTQKNINLKPLPLMNLTLRQALVTGAFWLIVITSIFYCFSYAAALNNQVSIFVWKGFDSASAITAVGIVGLFSTGGKFFFGWLCDRIEPKYSAAIAFGMMGISLIIMAQAVTMPQLWIYAVIVGIAQGGWAPNLAMLTIRYFGIRHFGTILGTIYFLFYAGQSLGPVTVGAVFDKTGDYIPMLFIMAMMCIISIPLIIIIRAPGKKKAALDTEGLK